MGEKPCPEGLTGGNQVYTPNCRETKKLIPVNIYWLILFLSAAGKYPEMSNDLVHSRCLLVNLRQTVR
jgi:hypothetical protein